jgi:hypothetical protein
MNTEWRGIGEWRHFRDMPKRSDPKTGEWDVVEAAGTAERAEVDAPTASETADRQPPTDDADPPHFDLEHKLRDLGAAIMVTTEVLAATMDLGRVAGDALQTVNVEIPIRDNSIAQLVGHRKEQEVNYVIDKESEDRKRMNSGEGRETVS